MASEMQQTSGPAARRIGAIVVIIIATIGVFMIVPAIQAQREMSRRARCLNNGHQIGLALQNYASTYANALPPSAQLYGTGTTKTVGGYSFLVKIVPFMDDAMEYGSLYKSLPRPNSDGTLQTGNAALATAMNTSLKELVCPSNSNNVFQNPTVNPPTMAFTNYKAMGATTRDSLLMASNSSGKPPYGTTEMHPDGALFPSDKNMPMSAIVDGTSHTILIVETIDDANSRWMVGNECTLVGIPQASGVTEKTEKYPFYAPRGFDNTFGEDSAVSRAGLRTFLMYDFSPGGADAGTYEDPGWAKGPPAYGPSSMHPAVAIVCMCDGSVLALNKRCDAADLFFLITKSNSDAFSCGPL
jgi:hypothetical protein